eukprot:26032-Eustigmatos_ZCMA.PRE.1
MSEDEGEIHVNPPDSLLKYEPPVFVGLEPSQEQGQQKYAGEKSKHKHDGSSQLDDMLNSMLAPR